MIFIGIVSRRVCVTRRYYYLQNNLYGKKAQPQYRFVYVARIDLSARRKGLNVKGAGGTRRGLLETVRFIINVCSLNVVAANCTVFKKSEIFGAIPLFDFDVH